MRIFRNILGSLALGALIVYTMRLPDHPNPPAPFAPLPAVPASTIPAAALVPALPIAAEFQLPITPVRRSHVTDNCFAAEPENSIPVIWGPNAVITAALKQDWDVVRKLIDAGASVQSTDEKGRTPLMIAAQQGNLEMLRTLLERQARIDFTDFEGRTALNYAMAGGKRDAVDVLLALSKNLDPSSAAARELLTAPLTSGDMPIFQTILERFSPTLEWTPMTRTALEAAVSHGMREQVRLLLSKHPAPPTRENGVVPLIAYAIVADDTSLLDRKSVV